MDLGLVLLAPLLAASVGATAENPQIEDEYRQITIAVTSLPSCRQLGYSVDREGLIAWSEAARSRAVAAGATEREAEARLISDIRFEHQRLMDRFQTVVLLNKTNKSTGVPRAFTDRVRGYWVQRCDELARDDATAGFFDK